MNQVLTPEEMAALFEGLREAEKGPDPRYCRTSQEIRPRGRLLSEPYRVKSFQNLSAWLMVLADLRWPNL